VSGQKKRHSAFEAVVNVVVGLVVSFAFQILVFPLLGIYVSLATNAEIAVYFTVVSLGRSYLLRRLFNTVTVRQAKRCKCQTS